METYLQTLSECLPGGFDELPLWRRTAHALYPSEALKFIGTMSGPTCPPEQMARLRTALIPLRQANVQAQSLRLSPITSAIFPCNFLPKKLL